jgi:hypothetical protein
VTETGWGPAEAFWKKKAKEADGSDGGGWFHARVTYKGEPLEMVFAFDSRVTCRQGDEPHTPDVPPEVQANINKFATTLFVAKDVTARSSQSDGWSPVNGLSYLPCIMSWNSVDFICAERDGYALEFSEGIDQSVFDWCDQNLPEGAWSITEQLYDDYRYGDWLILHTTDAATAVMTKLALC